MIMFFLVFIGVFLVLNGIYEQKLRAEVANVKVEYRFIPRSYYDEQMGVSDVSLQFDKMFNGDSTWAEVTTGAVLNVYDKTTSRSGRNPIHSDNDHSGVRAK